MKKILLNWLPPAQLNSPSPSFSVLKGYLEQGGYMVDIRYWNIDLDAYLKDFFVYGGETYEHQRGNSSIQQLLPLLAYLAIQNKDESLIGKIRNYVLSLKPQLNDKTNNFFNNYLKKFYDNLNFIIDKTLSNIILTNYLYLGFSSQYYQWIAANIIIERIKLISPNSVVVIGGCGSKQEAYALANNFKHFNFISWGEGEFLLLELTRYLDTTYHSEVNLTDIPNIVFRNGDQLVVSQISNVFVDINQSTYDYSDYFSQIKHSSIAQKIKVKLPFEKSRGCHWRKCHFCSLNTGYKFRSKSSEKAIDEIKDSITKYNTNEYFFVDNDVVANDIPGFEDFLDMLIEFRTTLHNDFKISMAEIITDGINSTIIKKMSLAGFEKIQIGYESPSSRLLEKIDKKNSFASNLLTIKWSQIFGIKISGANVIRNLLEETDKDIEESIKNLYYLRFQLRKGVFSHSMSFLAISQTSPYFKKLSKEELAKFEDGIFSYLPYNYLQDEDKYSALMDYVNPHHNGLWHIFEKVEAYYLNNTFSYRLISNEGLIFYREFFNNHPIKELEFEKKLSPHWYILEKCNHHVSSIDVLANDVILNQLLYDKSLENVISTLYEEGLIYSNADKSRLIAVINTNAFE